jgi:hypothetical protein
MWGLSVRLDVVLVITKQGTIHSIEDSKLTTTTKEALKNIKWVGLSSRSILGVLQSLLMDV